jgi:DNA-binding NtrC family response regulator
MVFLGLLFVSERVEDILALAQAALDELGAQQGVRRKLSARAEQALLAYPWPGNVRELRHCIERASIVSSREMLEPVDLFEETSPALSGKSPAASLGSYLEECERSYIAQALSLNQGRIVQTAATLGISRKNLWEKMKKLGIEGSPPSA